MEKVQETPGFYIPHQPFLILRKPLCKRISKKMPKPFCG